MQAFAKEFNTLHYIINKSNSILLFAHNGPDGDTIGANLALKEYIESLGKRADIACFDPFPAYLENLLKSRFDFPEKLDLALYDAIIACDSVERGFDKIFPKLSKNHASVHSDQPPDMPLAGDVNTLESAVATVCEI
ncbi:MAG: hypothetical protein Q7S18_02895, partial [bacterium]|nr:hypothetical protein [bacterium]